MKCGVFAVVCAAAVVSGQPRYPRDLLNDHGSSQDAISKKTRPPSRASEVARASDNAVWRLIVAGDTAHEIADLVALANSERINVTALFQRAKSFAATVTKRELMSLVNQPIVSSVWLFPDTAVRHYTRVLQGLEYAIATLPGPNPINMSLVPGYGPIDWPYDSDEPIHRVFDAAAARGHVVVVAAGNAFGENTLSPWCASAHVICVGATNADGKRLASFSARGVENDRRLRPSVVAHGIDVLTTHSPRVPKTAELLAAERRVGFDTLVAADKRHLYTVVSGTSFATPTVTSVVAQLFHFFAGLADDLEKRGQNPDTIAFEVAYETSQPSTDTRVVGRDRVIGRWHRSESGITVRYPARSSPELLIQIVHDLAMPMPGYRAHEAGAGFVSYERAQRYFGQFGQPDVRLLPVKVVRN